jgi:hypothetical protein
MTLFESDSQYREKAAIWRIFSFLPLYAPLAQGHVWKWFAANIPMDLGTGGKFTSDIDIVARLHNFPRSKEWFFKTWEVKVSLLCKDGTARSLKIGKIGKLMKQLNAYREFGSPDVGLLEVYLLEAGFQDRNNFPTTTLNDIILEKRASLRREGFGYHLLPFGHGQDSEGDVGLFALHNSWSPLQTNIPVLTPVTTTPRQPFLRFAERLQEFSEQAKSRGGSAFRQIVFCRACRKLQLIRMRNEYSCPACGNDLIVQS